MTEKQIKLTVGALLHDIGKILYRSGDGRKHSVSGYEFVKNEVGIKEQEILDSIRYHHGDELSQGKNSENSCAYITYIADNIATITDPREEQEPKGGFDPTKALESIFNKLNNNDQKFSYAFKTLSKKDGVNFPQKWGQEIHSRVYQALVLQLKENLKGLEWTNEYVNSLLEIMEGNLSYVPSSTSKSEVADISLFDHLKLTAAMASCIYGYLEEKKITDYKTELYRNPKSFYEKETFLMYSLDISGIQDFIYTITSQGALKTLRARSFYLEILMEHIIDEILWNTGFSRANLIYSGGGHCYLLFPNTQKLKESLTVLEKQINQWFLKQFGTSLYIAGGYSTCSANSLKNIPTGSYKQIFRNMSETISEKKLHRYSVEEILALNTSPPSKEKECKICKMVGKINEDEKCDFCESIEIMSGNILYHEFFTVTLKHEKHALPLPFGKYFISDDKDSLKKRMEEDTYYVRSYGKNEMYIGKHIASKLWTGDYSTGKTFEQFAKEATGINRMAVFRADVDNLGSAFVSGFESEKYGDYYVTISRTATLSRQLSMFFKYYINEIFEHSQFSLSDKEPRKQATIVYSGGDDLFLVGSWDAVIELAVELRNAFIEYTQGTLTLSGGIGVYQSGYPISISAKEVELLEGTSKGLEGKDGITLFAVDHVFKWDVFIDKIVEEKYRLIKNFFENTQDKGKSFLHGLLELVRNRTERINFARYVYLLSRMEPGEKVGDEQRELYKKFSKLMYEWMRDEESSRQLVAAIYLYEYISRKEEE